MPLWFYYAFWAFSYIIIDHSCLNSCIFTKLWLIRCLINTRLLIYWHARCHSKLWNVYWYYSVFCKFCTQLTNIHVWSDLYRPNFYGFSINTLIFICWNSRCNYKLRKVPWFDWVLWKLYQSSFSFGSAKKVKT